MENAPENNKSIIITVLKIPLVQGFLALCTAISLFFGILSYYKTNSSNLDYASFTQLPHEEHENLEASSGDETVESTADGTGPLSENVDLDKNQDISNVKIHNVTTGSSYPTGGYSDKLVTGQPEDVFRQNVKTIVNNIDINLDTIRNKRCVYASDFRHKKVLMNNTVQYIASLEEMIDSVNKFCSDGDYVSKVKYYVNNKESLYAELR